jgi:hypothetical protein
MVEKVAEKVRLALGRRATPEKTPRDWGWLYMSAALPEVFKAVSSTTYHRHNVILLYLPELAIVELPFVSSTMRLWSHIGFQ